MAGQIVCQCFRDICERPCGLANPFGEFEILSMVHKVEVEVDCRVDKLIKDVSMSETTDEVVGGTPFISQWWVNHCLS